MKIWQYGEMKGTGCAAAVTNAAIVEYRSPAEE